MDLTAYIRKRLESRRILMMTHVIAGYPSLQSNWEMLAIMESVGVDVVELQMPFSEPIADGPTFVSANQIALEKGLVLDDYFDLMQRASKAFSFPQLMMGYYNTAYQLGHREFCNRLRAAGGVGYILPDLPYEEYDDLWELSEENELSPILLMTPTNTLERLAAIGERVKGFVYAVARKGVTGRKTELGDQPDNFLKNCRRVTESPLALGFGLQTGDDLRELQGKVEMAVVGSALLETWEAEGADGFRAFLQDLSAGCR